MRLHNLAEPIWLAIDCNINFLKNVICIKDKIPIETVNINNRSLKNRHFCGTNALFVDGMCYDFHWTQVNIDFICARKYIKVDIMIFKHIFEAIALEDRHLSAFMKHNIKTLSSVTFIRYLDTVSFDIKVKSFSKAEGYIICPSKKNKIDLGTHIFNCSGGGNILSYHICDGTIDCRNDRSDEDFCTCNDRKDSKMCRIINHNLYSNTCSSTYYMTINGECLKYTSPDQIYQTFNITMDVPTHRKEKTSKLTIYNESANIFQKKVNGNIYFESVSKFQKYFTCLNKGEVPCWEGHFKCYNLSSLCIYQMSVNQNLIPCENGRHLQQCKTFLCDIMFKCFDNYCISWPYVCDGKWDCPKGDDEQEHPICNKLILCLNMYHCRNTKQLCIHLGNTCDGYNDCPFGDDELLCELKYFECPSFCVCLLYAIDCRMNSDNKAKMIIRFQYLFVHFSNIKLNLENPLILSLSYATVVKLQKTDISDICDAFNEAIGWRCILLDLSYNLLKSVGNNCFFKYKITEIISFK